MILSILICSVTERLDKLKLLINKFNQQKNGYEIEILVEIDNKQVSVGAKRQTLLQKAKGDWITFFDDDDDPSDKYVSLIVNAIRNNPNIDCIGIRGRMTTNGVNQKTWCHRLGYPIEGDGNTPLKEGYDYIRPIIHFNPVLRAKALQAGFRDLRFGEDMDYAKRLNPLLEKEYFIDEELFHYRYSTKINHKEKYGIK